MISVNNLKKDSKNDNEKVGIPSFPPPKLMTSYVDDLDLFKDFENEFTSIVYNDDLTSKSDYLTEQTLSPRHNNESDFNDEISLSEYDVVGQNILYFNDLFPFNVIYPNDLKSDEDNDNNEIYIIQSLGVKIDMAPLPPREQRHPFLRVQVVDFQGMPELMRDGLFARMVMDHRDDAGVVFLSTVRFKEVFLDLDAPGTIQFQLGLIVIAPELTIIDMGELDALIVDEGGHADPTLIQAPPLPPASARTMPQRMARLEEDVHEISGALTDQREVIDAMAYDFSKFSTWAITSLARMMDRAGVTYVPYFETHVPY
ncbi:hypothetical protein Tco_0671540 [Tanacetum coccineum]